MAKKKNVKMSKKKRQQLRDQQISRAAGILILLVLSYFAYQAVAPKFKGASSMSNSELIDPNVEIVTTDSGLQYQDLVVGSGDEAVAGMTVTVHYTGWLEADGTKFDSSVDRGQPFVFPLGAGRVIKGWDEGVAGMKIGGKRLLIIPAELGYGAQGAGGSIPPGATLIFEVDLLGVGN